MSRSGLLVLFFLSWISSATAQGRELDVPGPDEQSAALLEIQKRYPALHAEADIEARKWRFLLLMQRAEREGKPALRFVLLQEARRIALLMPSVPHAVLASKKLASQFKLEPLPLMQDTLGQLAKNVNVKETASCRDLSIAYRHVAKAALIVGEIDTTTQLLGRSLVFARRSKSADLLSETQSVEKQFGVISKLSVAASVARANLAIEPMDPEANSALGTYLCFVLGDWDRGLTFLSLAAEPEYRNQAFRDGSGTEDATIQVEIAKRWRDLASKQRGPASDLKKAQICRRARLWYLRALKQLTGLERDRVRMVLEALEGPDRDPLLEPTRKRWFVLFRSSDPGLWNRTVNMGGDHFALSLDHAPVGLRYLRLRIVNQDKSLIIRMKKKYLDKDIRLRSYGWNGTSALEYNSRHLGIYDATRHGREGAVETKFALQGWGFGHLYDVKKQAWAWNGRPLSRETVFEIAVTEQHLSSKEQKRLLR